MIDRILVNISLIYMEKGAYKEALAHLQDALERGIERYGQGDYRLASIYRTFGDCHRNMGKHADALAFYNKSIAVERKGSPQIAWYHYYKGKVYDDMYKFEKGVEEYQLALEALDPDRDYKQEINLANSPRIHLAILLAKGRANRLSYIYQKANKEKLYEAVKTIQFAVQMTDSLHEDYLSQSGMLKYAERTKLLYQEGRELAWTLYELTGEYQYLEMAFQMSEKGKALILLMGIQDVIARESAGIPEVLLEKESRLNDEIVSLRTSLFRIDDRTSSEAKKKEEALFRLENAKDSLMTVFKTYYPQYFQMKYNHNQLSPTEISQMLPDSTTLIEYAIGDEYYDSYVFWINKEGLSGLKLAVDDSLRKIIGEFRKYTLGTSISASDIGQLYEQSAFTLYEKLVKPFEANIPDAFGKWMIIPDGELGYINFGALLQEQPSKLGDYQNYSYLLHSRQMSYHYSAKLMHYFAGITNKKKGHAKRKTTCICSTVFCCFWPCTCIKRNAIQLWSIDV